MNRDSYNAGYAAYRAEDWDGALVCFSGSDPKSRIAQAYVWMNRTDGKAVPEKAFAIFRELAEREDPKAIDHLRQWGEDVSAFEAIESDFDAVLFSELKEH